MQKNHPIIVKFVTKGPAQPNQNIWLRQFPGLSGIWGDCRFIFDPDANRYDWLVVYDDMPCLENERFSNRRETLACPQENTLLITTEPVTVKTYSTRFLAQFGHVLTSQEPSFIHHPSACFSQAGLHWFYGIGKSHYKTYDEMKAALPPEKMKSISTVCSSKRQKHTLHNLRYEFTLKLKAAHPEMEQFGHGVQLIDDKAQALDQFKYHLSIENHICRHHWTEKLADSFLGFCLPFYCGCPNASDYFPEESFIPVDLFDFEKSLDTIRTAMDGNEYEKRFSAMIEARRLVLDEYNLFAVLSKMIKERHIAQSSAGQATIASRRVIRKDFPLSHFGYLISHFPKRLKMRLK